MKLSRFGMKTIWKNPDSGEKPDFCDLCKIFSENILVWYLVDDKIVRNGSQNTTLSCLAKNKVENAFSQLL